MPGIGRKIIIKTRDRLFSKVIKAIDAIEKRISVVESNQAMLASQQLEWYAKINDELKKKNTNSTIFQVSTKEIIAKTFSGTKISLNPEDISVTPHLALDGIWEKDVTLAWLKVLSPKDTVLDIGANFGYYGLLAAQQTHVEKSKVIFFEANPKLIPYITKTLSINNYYEHSIVENLAVAEKEGVVTLNVLKDYIGSSSLHSLEQLDAYVGEKIHLEAAESIKVKATTIDAYCKAHKIPAVDLIKMDIEGYEDKAYKGMREIIKASPRVTMFMEFTKGGYDKPEEFYRELMEDFDTVCAIGPDGALVQAPKVDYQSLLGDLDDWIMLVFTKNQELIKTLKTA